ncbi:MAG: nucleotidyltransferase family protein [Candidatus Eremiobacteraeota bacterium]|nr:nucleotidyltransferase family protein [Candidatus Eremiobacteraeota bacterium]
MTTPRVGCVILAAGAGRRFGAVHHKLAASFEGKPLLQHVVDSVCASRAMSCTLVCGANAAALLASVETRRCCVLCNPRWDDGIASSIRCGVAQHAHDDACVFVVADQPLVSAADIDGLIRVFAAQRDGIAALRASGVWGTPMLFPRSDFAALTRLRGDHGAKRYAQSQKKRLQFVQAVNEDVFADVDRPEDLARLTRRHRRL